MTEITKWFVIQRCRLRPNGEEQTDKHGDGWHDWSNPIPAHAERDAFRMLERAQKLDTARRYLYQLLQVEERREILA